MPGRARPRRPIRVGIVGLGNVGLGFHLPAWLELPELATVVALADPAEERRVEATRRTGFDSDRVYASPMELIGRDDVDLIDLATPPHVRAPLALEAIRRGRALLCEKPVSTVPADAAAIVDAAARRGVPVGVVHNYLHFPEILVALNALRAGRIGQPEVAILNYLGVEDRPGSDSWRPHWRHEPGLAGGGVLMDMLHVVYLAEGLLGAPFRRVSAQLLARSSPAPVEDIAVCRFETEDAVALVNVGWGVGPGGIVVSGSTGRLEIAYAGGGTSPFAPLAAVRLVGAAGSVEDLTPPPAQPGLDVHLVETLRSFLDAVGDRLPPPASAVDGLRVLEATLAAYASAAVGKTISLPLDRSDPVYRRGLAGLAELPLVADGSVARRGFFGLQSTGG